MIGCRSSSLRKIALFAIFLLLWTGQSQASTTSRAQKLYKKGEWRKAAISLNEHLKKNPKDLKALLLRGKIALSEEDLNRGVKLLLRAKKLAPKKGEVYYLLARAYLGLRKYKKSYINIYKAQKLRPRWHKIYLAKAWLFVGYKKLKVAIKEANKAQKLAPQKDYGYVYAALGYLHFRLKKISKARMYFKKALKYQSDNRLAHWYLGTGLGRSSNNNRLRKSPKDWKLLQKAIGALEKTDYSQACRILDDLARRYPRNATCHFVYAHALTMKRHSRHRISYMKDFQVLQNYSFAPQISDKVMGKFFVNYRSLTRWEKEVLKYSVGPLRKYLPFLISQGIRHYILPLEKRISELPHMTSFANRYTHDGRRFGDIRGVTAENAVTGREAIAIARNFGFNTVAHEFAHQVHMHAFSYSQRNRVRKLYRQAKRQNRCLDYYAASTIYEYFAQGYEAFISIYKRPSLGATALHTRQELKDKDPALYRFIEKLTLPPLSRVEKARLYYRVGKIHLVLLNKKKAQEFFWLMTFKALGINEEEK